MKRTAQPNVSPEGQLALNRYSDYLHHEQDLSADTRRNYLSDLRQFAAWCEASWTEGQEAAHPFAPAAVATSLLTQYRAYLQTVCKLQPATINRHLVSLKRYFAWATERGEIQRDSAKVVKVMPLVRQPPRHLTAQEENPLIAAVTAYGLLRDRPAVHMQANNCSAALHWIGDVMVGRKAARRREGQRRGGQYLANGLACGRRAVRA